MAQEANIDAYFERVGFAGSIAPNLETLGQLHQLHLAAIPFENLDELRGAPVRLELANLQQKLLFDRRGGICLEHNLLFKAVLEALDYEVKAHAARVLWNEPDDEASPSHLVLTVAIAAATYLVDVGFGGLTPTAPLRLRADVEQPTPHESFRLTGGDPVWQVEAQVGETFRPLYSFTSDELGGEGVAIMSERASSDQGLHDNLIVTRVDKGRRLVLNNLRLRTYPTGVEREERHLTGLDELKDTLRGPFGIELPTDERIEAALERIIARETEPETP